MGGTHRLDHRDHRGLGIGIGVVFGGVPVHPSVEGVVREDPIPSIELNVREDVRRPLLLVSRATVIHLTRVAVTEVEHVTATPVGARRTAFRGVDAIGPRQSGMGRVGDEKPLRVIVLRPAFVDSRGQLRHERGAVAVHAHVVAAARQVLVLEDHRLGVDLVDVGNPRVVPRLQEDDAELGAKTAPVGLGRPTEEVSKILATHVSRWIGRGMFGAATIRPCVRAGPRSRVCVSVATAAGVHLTGSRVAFQTSIGPGARQRVGTRVGCGVRTRLAVVRGCPRLRSTCRQQRCKNDERKMRATVSAHGCLSLYGSWPLFDSGIVTSRRLELH